MQPHLNPLDKGIPASYNLCIDRKWALSIRMQVKGETMDKPKTRKLKDRFIWVKDREGNEFVCAVDSLRDPNELTEEEKSQCMDAAGPRGLVSPI
jgi:hypothetical protein